MMADAIAIVVKAFTAAAVEFGRILNAIPGSQALIVAAFFLTVTVGMLIMPLRGGRFISTGGDLSTESVREVTSTYYSPLFPNGYTTRTVSHTKTSRTKRSKGD